MEKSALDMSAVLLRAYELGDMILASREVADYLRGRKMVAEDAAAQGLIRRLGQKKDLFEECQRFGHFHPEYHKALNEVEQVQKELDALPSVTFFKNAEDELDELLYEVSASIAYSVSDTVKVPSNKLKPQSGGCSSGGSCSGNCGC